MRYLLGLLAFCVAHSIGLLTEKRQLTLEQIFIVTLFNLIFFHIVYMIIIITEKLIRRIK